MKVRIRFSSEIYIEGKDIADISDKWGAIELFSDEAKRHSADYIEIESVEDADTYADVTDEWDEAN